MLTVLLGRKKNGKEVKVRKEGMRARVMELALENVLDYLL